MFTANSLEMPILWITLLVLVLVVLAIVAVATQIMARRSSKQLNARLDQFQSRINEIENRIDLRPIIPPMSIFLERIEHRWHVVDDLCRQIDNWMLLHEFNRIGYFRIAELDNEELCVYLSKDHLLVAAVRMAKDLTEPFAEFCFDLGSGDRGGVSNPPISVIRPSGESSGCHFDGKLSSDLSLLNRMYQKAIELIDHHRPRPIDPDRIGEFFEEAHENEMASRVHCGGITESEIHDVLIRQGVLPTAAHVTLIQRQWQLAIEDYLLEFSARGKNKKIDGCQILIVHQGSLSSYLIDQLRPLISRTLQDSRRSEALVSELSQLLKKLEPREAITRLRSLLPVDRDFDLIDQMIRPVPADVYAWPISVTT